MISVTSFIVNAVWFILQWSDANVIECMIFNNFQRAIFKRAEINHLNISLMILYKIGK